LGAQGDHFGDPVHRDTQWSSKIPGACFPDVTEALQAAGDTAAKGLGGPESSKMMKSTRYMLQNSSGVFTEVAEAPQAAATQTHRAGWA